MRAAGRPLPSGLAVPVAECTMTRARTRVLMSKIVPWVERQIIEEFGVSEKRLVNMICSKVHHRESAEAVETELKKVRVVAAAKAFVLKAFPTVVPAEGAVAGWHGRGRGAS